MHTRKWILCAYVLSGCTTLTSVEQINSTVNNGIKYRHIPDGGIVHAWPKFGDCGDYAYTKIVELRKVGLDGRMRKCELESGEWHAFVELSDGRVMDNRANRLLTRRETGCKLPWYSWHPKSEN